MGKSGLRKVGSGTESTQLDEKESIESVSRNDPQQLDSS